MSLVSCTEWSASGNTRISMQTFSPRLACKPVHACTCEIGVTMFACGWR